MKGMREISGLSFSLVDVVSEEGGMSCLCRGCEGVLNGKWNCEKLNEEKKKLVAAHPKKSHDYVLPSSNKNA